MLAAREYRAVSAFHPPDWRYEKGTSAEKQLPCAATAFALQDGGGQSRRLVSSLASARNFCDQQLTMSVAGARKGPGRPAVNATAINVRLPPDQLEALDAFIASSGGNINRPEALRRLLSAVSSISGAGEYASDVADQVALVEQGRRAAAGYARAKGRMNEAAAIEAGDADASPLVQTMMWFQLP